MNSNRQIALVTGASSGIGEAILWISLCGFTLDRQNFAPSRMGNKAHA